MSSIQAKNNYTGLGGGKRMNCAQAVASAFKDRYNLTEEMVDGFGACGGGNAPEGLCGAFYAVRSILDKHDKDRLPELEQYFSEHAGALHCSHIKGLKRISCVGCVEKGAEFLERS